MMETPHSADCPKFLGNLQRLVDGEMNDLEEQEFIESIKPHMQCFEKYEIEISYKEFLLKKLERKQCTEKMISKIEASIHQFEEEV